MFRVIILLENNSALARTVQRRLNEFVLVGRVAKKNPLLSKKNKNARLRFAKEHFSWTPEDWGKVLFIDESKYNRMGSGGKNCEQMFG